MSSNTTHTLNSKAKSKGTLTGTERSPVDLETRVPGGVNLRQTMNMTGQSKRRVVT